VTPAGKRASGSPSEVTVRPSCTSRIVSSPWRAGYRQALEDRLAATTDGLRWLEGKTLELGQVAGLEIERDAAGWPRFDLLVEALAARLRGTPESEPAAGAGDAAPRQDVALE
jgi:hypothetical protein